MEWQRIAEGAHGQVRGIRTKLDSETIFCLKLFREDDEDAYRREIHAYVVMKEKGLKRCIPTPYFTAIWPRWKWDGEQPDDYSTLDREEILYGIVMEFFEDCQEIDLKRVNLKMAGALLRTLDMMHETGVYHRDIEDRNILLVKEEGQVRVVWIDFSSAWIGLQYGRSQARDWNDLRAILVENMVDHSFSIYDIDN